MLVAIGDGNDSQPSTNYTSSTNYNSSPVQWSEPCRLFKYQEILSATKNFDELLVIGQGRFGKVYKGNLVNGSSLVHAAIKRFDSLSGQEAFEFRAEVETLSRLHHSHLVPLIGYCDYREEMILVYEYISNGTLDEHLHKVRTRLSWVQRLKICIGAARGLDYLHTSTGIQFGIIHRYVKTSNILLNKCWGPRIMDFGLAKILPTDQELADYANTLVKGTFGYMDPKYFYTGNLSIKSDIYAFGVVLFEVLCRNRAVDTTRNGEQWGLATWAQASIKDGRLKHIIDPDIRDQISPIV